MNHRLGLTFCFSALLCAVPHSARTASDSYTEEATRWLGFVNRDCGSNITLAPLDVADLEARDGGNNVNFCGQVFKKLRDYCQQDSASPDAGKPHPAGQAFVKENVKSIACGLGPDADKPAVTVALKNGVLTFKTTPKFATQSETDVAMRNEPALAKIWVKRRLWDVDNLQIPEASKLLKEACGDDMTISLDVPTWQARGNLLDYPDMAAADICSDYARGIITACKENKAQTRARVTGIRCGLLPKAQEHAEAKISIAGKQVVVMIGDLGSNIIDSGNKVYKVLKK